MATWLPEVKRLKRDGELGEAIELLLHLVDVVEADAQFGVAPAYYEQLAICYAKRGDLESEIAILERYEAQPKAPGAGPKKLRLRLEKARSRIASNDGQAEPQHQASDELALPSGAVHLHVRTPMGRRAVATASELASGDLKWGYEVLHEGEWLEASAGGAPLFAVRATDRITQATPLDSVGSLDVGWEMPADDTSDTIGTLLRVRNKVIRSVTALLDEDAPLDQVLPDLRRIARTVSPKRVRYHVDDQSISAPALWEEPQQQHTLYGVAQEGAIPNLWHSSTDSAWGAGEPGGVLYTVAPAGEDILLEIWGVGTILDPDRISPAVEQPGGLVDPVTKLDWSQQAQAELEENTDEFLSQLFPDSIGRGGVRFVLVGGPVVVVTHLGTDNIVMTGEASGTPSWILEDRLIESSDWLTVALRIADQLLDLVRCSDPDAYALAWRTANFAGPIIKVAKRVTGTRFHQLESLGLDEHALIRDQFHPPSDKWVWVRPMFGPPVEVRRSQMGAIETGADLEFESPPSVLLVATVERQVRMSRILNSMGRPLVVIAPDSPRMRRFSDRYTRGQRFSRTDDDVPRFDSWRWKRTERGEVTAGAFGTTYIGGFNDIDPRLLDAAIRYVDSKGEVHDVWTLLADPLVRAVLAERVPNLAFDEDTRATAAAESRLAPYWRAWDRLGSCFFYDSDVLDEAGLTP